MSPKSNKDLQGQERYWRLRTDNTQNLVQGYLSFQVHYRNNRGHCRKQLTTIDSHNETIPGDIEMPSRENTFQAQQWIQTGDDRHRRFHSRPRSVEGLMLNPDGLNADIPCPTDVNPPIITDVNRLGMVYA